VSAPGGCIAAAPTNAAEPSMGQVHVTMREDFTAMPLKVDMPDRATRANCKESLLEGQALRHRNRRVRNTTSACHHSKRIDESHESVMLTAGEKAA